MLVTLLSLSVVILDVVVLVVMTQKESLRNLKVHVATHEERLRVNMICDDSSPTKFNARWQAEHPQAS
jgi:hypothetical protein